MLYSKLISVDVVADIEIIQLCQLLHKLPHEVMQMDPDWLWKFNVVAGIENERAERDSKK